MTIAAAVSTSLAGCIVHTHNHESQRRSRVESCPPAYHWERGACVHNGHGHGNGNGKHRR